MYVLNQKQEKATLETLANTGRQLLVQSNLFSVLKNDVAPSRIPLDKTEKLQKKWQHWRVSRSEVVAPPMLFFASLLRGFDPSSE